MPIIGVPLRPTDTGAKVGELHVQLLALGAVIASDEQTGKNFGPSTGAAVRAFRQRYGLPPGDTVDLPTARLMHVASTFASGGRAPLAAAVREASAADTSQPQVLYWLARYATLAGDYQTAHTIAGRIPDHPDVKAVIDPILALPDQAQPTPGQPPPLAPPPRPPEGPYPENFYTYRYDLVRRELLDELLGNTASDPTLRLRRRPPGQDGENDFPDDLPEPPPDPTDEDTPVDERPRTAVQEAASSWLDAAHQWRQGNEHFEQRRYASAAGAYQASQRAALRYFEKYYNRSEVGTNRLELGTGLLSDRVTRLVGQLYNRSAAWPHLWESLQQRRLFLTLVELHGLDWEWFSDAAEKLLRQYLGRDPADDALRETTRQRLLDRPMLILAAVFIPLARAEANRARRQYSAADSDLSWVLTPFRIRVPVIAGPLTFRLVSLTCDFIERPFAQLLRAETLLDQADAEYKARTPAKRTRAPDVTQFQSLKAAQTYLAIKDLFRDEGVEGAYVSRVETATTELTEAIRQRLVAKDTSSQEFQLLGKNILVPTLVSASPTLPGLDRRAKAHEPLLKFTPPAGQAVMRETNPRVYAAFIS